MTKLKFKDTKIIPLDKQVNKEPSLVPKHPFSMQMNGSKGSGKSSTLLNMLLNPKILNKVFNRIIFVSPTSMLDQKVRKLDDYDVVVANFPLAKKIWKDRIEKMGERQAGSFKDCILANNLDNTEIEWKESISQGELDLIAQQQADIISRFGKEFSNKILIVLDDMAGDSRFYKSDQLAKFLFNSRHRNCSIIMTSQNYYSIPKKIRTNNSQLILWDSGNEKENKTIYEENCNKINFKQFNQIYRTCVDVDFGFLVINYQNPKKFIYQQQFEHFLVVD